MIRVEVLKKKQSGQDEFQKSLGEPFWNVGSHILGPVMGG